jgi:hypothetical protein
MVPHCRVGNAEIVYKSVDVNQLLALAVRATVLAVRRFALRRFVLKDVVRADGM